MQQARSVLMVKPIRFGYNEQTADSNSFQNKLLNDSAGKIQDQALIEFDTMVAQLRNHGMEVIVFNDTSEPHTPDSIFPNNWFSTHPDGSLLIYPMCAPNRRAERKGEFIVSLLRDHHFDIKKITDLSAYETEGIYLEGTGSMVIDHDHKIIYANTSVRTQLPLLQKVAALTHHQLVAFKAVDSEGNDIYHTNVLMSIGNQLSVICLDALPNPSERELVQQSLEKSGKQVLAISREQMNAFAGNMLHLTNHQYQSIIVLSASAKAALNDEQLQLLSKHGHLLVPSIPTIEHYGGGSVRCMMGDIHLPKF